MQKKISLLVFLIVALFGISIAEEIVLQQGVDGYAGCTDAVIGKPQGYNPNSNYGSSQKLSAEYCPG